LPISIFKACIMSFDKAVANLHGNHYGKAAAVGDGELLFFWHRSNFELDGKAIFFSLPRRNKRHAHF
jgi:hypothetical protein